MPQDTFAILGENGLIDCLPPLSVPSPVVTWYRDSVPVTGEQYTVAANGSLLISSVSNANGGDYVCTALNELLQINRTSPPAHLSVYGNKYFNFCLELIFLVVQPVIVSHTPNLQIAQYSDVTLQCNVTGVPFPNITWYKDDVMLTSSNQLALTDEGLLLYNVSLNDEGTYSCVMSNLAGTDQAVITIDVIRK